MSTADFGSLPESAVVGKVEVKDSVDKGAENKEKKENEKKKWKKWEINQI